MSKNCKFAFDSLHLTPDAFCCQFCAPGVEIHASGRQVLGMSKEERQFPLKKFFLKKLPGVC